MPWDDDFYIGTSLDSNDFKKLSDWMSNLNKPVDPDWTFSPFAAFHDRLDGGRTGIGLPRATWKWNHRSDLHIQTLKDLCPGLSALIYIRTLTNELDVYGARIWMTFLAVMLWPENDEDKQAGYTLGFQLNFRNLVVQEEA